MHHGHHTVRCRYCDKLMESCRCMSKDKPVRYDTCELCSATHGREPSPANNRAEQVRHDYPLLREFHNKHGMPPLAKPSCLVCGRADYEWPPAIQHMELPAIVVCQGCFSAVGRLSSALAAVRTFLDADRDSESESAAYDALVDLASVVERGSLFDSRLCPHGINPAQQPCHQCNPLGTLGRV